MRENEPFPRRTTLTQYIKYYFEYDKELMISSKSFSVEIKSVFVPSK
jgi:hypothetical protein